MTKMTQREKQLRRNLILKIGSYSYYRFLKILKNTYEYGKNEANLVNEINFRINSGECAL